MPLITAFTQGVFYFLVRFTHTRVYEYRHVTEKSLAAGTEVAQESFAYDKRRGEFIAG